MLLIRVDFPDRPGDPVTDAGGQAMFAQASQLIRDSSWGKFWFENVDVTPTYRMPHASTYYRALEGAGACELAASAVAAAADLFPVDEYWSYAVGFTGIGFPWAGLGYVAARGVWLQGSGLNAGTVAHEFGHNIGMWHSTSWLVTDGNPVSPSGVWLNYGDPFDVMGRSSSVGQFSTVWKERAGWMDVNTNAITSPGLGIHRVYAHDFGEGTFVEDRTYAIRVPTGGELDPVYWLEYRQSPDASPQDAGIQIRLSSPWSEYLTGDADRWDLDTLILPVSGEGQDAADLALAYGDLFFEPNLDLVITYVGAGIGSDGNWWADLQIGLPGWQNPCNCFDVDADSVVSAYDVLLIINDINRNDARELPPRCSADRGLPFFDVNGDGKLTPEDILDVINEINRAAVAGLASDQTSEGEAISAEAPGQGGWWMLASADTAASAAGASSLSPPWPSFGDRDGAVEWANGTHRDSAVHPEFPWREQDAVRTPSPLSQLRRRTADKDTVHLNPVLPAWETLLEHRLADTAALDAVFAALA